MEGRHKICLKEARVLQIEPNTTYRKYKESANISLTIRSRQPSFDISLIWPPIFTSEIKQLKLRPYRLSGKISVFCVGTTEGIHLSTDDFYSDRTLMLGLIQVHVELFNVLS
jgi:hypothetical protein